MVFAMEKMQLDLFPATLLNSKVKDLQKTPQRKYFSILIPAQTAHWLLFIKYLGSLKGVKSYKLILAIRTATLYRMMHMNKQ